MIQKRLCIALCLFAGFFCLVKGEDFTYHDEIRWKIDGQSSEIKTYNWNKGRGYGSFKYATPTAVVIENETDSVLYDFFNFGSPANEFLLSFRMDNVNGKPGKAYTYFSGSKKRTVKNPSFGFFLINESDTLIFSSSTVEKRSSIESYPEMEMIFQDPSTKQSSTYSLPKGVNFFSGKNCWSISLCDGILKISCGNKGLKDVAAIDVRGKEISGFGFWAGWGAKINVTDITLEIPQRGNLHLYPFNKEEIDQYLLKSKDPMEGYWDIFDRELEESLIKLGGDYKLACIKEGHRYYFVYLEGASVLKKLWIPGDIKMILEPTGHNGIYNAEWIDSSKRSLRHDIKVQEDDSNVLTLQFPYQGSKLRLRKLD